MTHAQTPQPHPRMFPRPPLPTPHTVDPATDQVCTLEVILTRDGAPIASVELSLLNNNNGECSSRYSDGNGYTNHAVFGRAGDLITFQTNGFAFTGSTVESPYGPAYYLLTAETTQQVELAVTPFKRAPRPIEPVTRGPLPPFPEPINYRTELPWTPPAERDFLRGDFWGIVMPEAPWVPGASTNHPERVLSWFLDRYPPAFQIEYLRTIASYGYTHILLSYADSCGPVDNGPNSPPGNGRTLPEFLDTCRLAKTYVPFVKVMIGSKYFQPRDMSAQEWADFSDPIITALIANACADEITLGWEWNLWNTPGQPTIDAFRHFGQQCHEAGLSAWMHFSPHVTSWFKDGDSRGRFGFYDDLHNDVDGIDYQTQGPHWSPQMLQARIVDTLWQFGTRGNDYKFRLFEDLAAWQFDHDEVTVPVDDGAPQTVSVTPEDANLRGYIGCCTIDNVKGTDAKVWGFANGGRMPDGAPL